MIGIEKNDKTFATVINEELLWNEVESYFKVFGVCICMSSMPCLYADGW
jgi:hypothetical protein